MKKWIILLVMLWAGNCWGATYYASPTGSGTTCSEASPCTLTYALATKGSSNGDNIKLLPGTYSVTSQITQHSSNTTGVVESSDHDNMAVIDGTSASGNAMIFTYGGTYQYLIIQNGSSSGKPSLKINNTATATIQNCYFKCNQIHIDTANSATVLRYNVFEDSTYSPSYGVTFSGNTPYTTSVYYNLFLGNGRGVSSFIKIGNVTGTYNISNNLFTGSGSRAVETGTTFSGILGIKNNIFYGNSTVGDVGNIDINGTGTVAIANNAYVNAGYVGTYSNNIEGGSDATGQSGKRLLIGYRTPTYMYIRGDDLDQSAAYRANHTTVAGAVNALGAKTVHGIVVGHATSDDWVAAAALIDAGNEIAAHGWSHMSLDNDAANTYPFNVTYSGAGTASIIITESGSPGEDAVSLRLQESVSGDDCTINLADGSSSGTGCPADASAANMTGVRAWLDAKSYLACGAMDTDMNYPAITFSRLLNAGTYNLSGAASNLLFDVPRTHYYEMKHAKDAAEAGLLAAGKSYTVTTFIWPNYNLDSTAKASCLAYGYTVAMGRNSTDGAAATGYLSALDMFDLPTAQAALLAAFNQTQIEDYARAQAAAFTSGQRTGGLMFHSIGDFSAVNWGYYVNEILAHPGITNVTPKGLVAALISSGWATSDAGLTYTKTLSGTHSFSLRSTSPAINAGVVVTGVHDVAGVTDYAGNIIRGLPDIGAYERKGGGLYHGYYGR